MNKIKILLNSLIIFWQLVFLLPIGVQAQTYACPVFNGASASGYVWSCDSNNSPTCATIGSCASGTCQQIDSSACGQPTGSVLGPQQPCTPTGNQPCTPTGASPCIPTGNAPCTPTGNVGSPNNTAINCTGSSNSPNCVYNPLPADDLETMFLIIAKGFLGVVAIFSTIFIIVGGFQMVMAQGEEENYTKAKKTLVWAVLGLVIALLSFSIVAIVQNLLHAQIHAQ